MGEMTDGGGADGQESPLRRYDHTRYQSAAERFPGANPGRLPTSIAFASPSSS